MLLVLLGAPGAGKGTQAKVLEGELGVPQVSTGDMLRAAQQAGTALGRQVKGIMDQGGLVPDEIILGLVEERLARADARTGAILDGFPRTVAQAEGLDELRPVDRAVAIVVPEAELVVRLSGRRTCRACGRMYHVVFTPPARPGECDACGGELYQRADDNEDSIRNRLRVYHEATAPLVGYYRRKGVLAEVDGVGEQDEVTARVRQVLGARGQEVSR